jgi:hypothetical protein
MSQLNFFMTEPEFYDRLTEAKRQCSISIFEGRFFEKASPHRVPDLTDGPASQSLIIWSNNNFRAPTCSSKGLGKYEGLFLFSDYYDPIIEITICTITDKLISPGRMFYKNGWIKDAALDKFHTSVCKKIRRIFAKGLCDLSPPFKVSKDIQNMMTQGFKVELGFGGMQLPKS